MVGDLDVLHRKKKTVILLYLLLILFFFCLEKNLNRSSKSVKDVQDALVTTLDREGPAHCEFSCYSKIKSGNS